MEKSDRSLEGPSTHPEGSGSADVEPFPVLWDWWSPGGGALEGPVRASSSPWQQVHLDDARERLADFLEHNGGSCCQAFMLMLHSEQEWWISAGPAPRLSSCCRGRQIPKDGCQAVARRPT